MDNVDVIATPYDGGLFTVLTINISIGLLILVLFSICRTRERKSPSLIHGSANDTESLLGNNEETTFGWIPRTLKTKETEVFELCGRDAVIYLRFQRHLLVLLGVYTFFGLVVLLPINLYGEKNLEGFTATTVYNLAPDSPKLWANIAAILIFSILGFVMLFNFKEFLATSTTVFVKSSMQLLPDSLLTPLTVMIEGIPKEMTDGTELKHQLESEYPGKIYEVQMGYDMRRMIRLNQLLQMNTAKLERQQEKQQSLRHNLKPGSIESTLQRIDRINNEMESLREKKPKQGTGVAFVTFVNKNSARACILQGLQHSVQNNAREWKFRSACDPRQIIWENLGVSKSSRILRSIFINIGLVCILTFMTVPTAILSTFQTLGRIRVPVLEAVFHSLTAETVSATFLGGFLFSFLPSLVLLIMFTGMPYLFVVATYYEGHHIRSKQDHSLMRKTFYYLLVFILLLPSLTLTFLDVFIERRIYQAESMIQVLSKIFLAESGSLFVNVIITLAYIGNGLDLLRIPDWIQMKWRSFRAVTSREIRDAAEISKKRGSPFAYGINYSCLLVLFAVILLFSSFIPLILPFGFLYMWMKYVVDKYNLIFRCPKDYDSDGRILQSSLNHFIICIVLCQLAMAALLLVKGHHDQMGVVLGVTAATLLFYTFYTYRRQNYRRKRAQRMESVIRNQEVDSLEPEAILEPHRYDYRHALLTSEHPL